MGVAMYIVVQRKIDGLDTFVDGKAIGRASVKSLERICKSIGVPSPYDFVSQDPEELREFIEDVGGDMPETLPEEQWFRVDDGERLVSELLKYFEENPRSMRNVAGIVANLKEYQRLFEALALHDVKWHFAVDF